MIDQILKQEQGLTFDVFQDEQPAEGQGENENQEAENEEGAEGEDGQQKAKKEPEEVFPRSIYVKEVVREPRVHFYKVPKLGSYFAIRLEYDSCLFEGALDSAVADFIDVRQR